MTRAGHDPARKLWVQAIDVDRMAALMCYTQLSLWNVPAEIIVGNTLSWDIREVWYTPAHHMGLWKYRLHRMEGSTEVEISTTEKAAQNTPSPEPTNPLTQHKTEAPAVKPSQLGFDF
jgi:hypothetical protein